MKTIHPTRPFSFLQKHQSYLIVAVLFSGLTLLLHGLTATNYEPHRDEFLYFQMADHLSAGYVSVPPVTGFLAWISKSVLGHSIWALRILPALASALTMIFMTLILIELGGGISALWIALSAFLLSPLFLIWGTLFTPNGFEAFWWTVLFFIAIRLIKSNNPIWWLMAGALAGFAFLTKYLVVIPVAGMIFSLFLMNKRSLVFNRYFLGGMVIFLAIISPNLVWQATHQWPVLNHAAALQESQSDILNPLTFISGLLTSHSGSTLVWIAGIGGLFFIPILKPFRFIAWTVLLVIGAFILLPGKDYYTAGLMPVLFVAGGITLAVLVKNFKSLTVSVLIVAATLSIISFPAGLPILSHQRLMAWNQFFRPVLLAPFSTWEDGENHGIQQVWSDMTGWKQLSDLVYQTWASLDPVEQSNCLIYAERNYGIAGALHFYGKDMGLPDAVTFLDNYTLWAPDSANPQNMIFIFRHTEPIAGLYQSVIKTGTVNDPYFRENGLSVFLARGPLPDIEQIYRQKAAMEKQVYRKN